MEKKTMGSFIAALRKANGMTQKDVAEKLAVTDKAVSRWERDEALPDITFLPVLAEMFGVTCDELLKGEKATDTVDGKEHKDNRKVEKQRNLLIVNRLTKFKGKMVTGVMLMQLSIPLFLVLYAVCDEWLWRFDADAALIAGVLFFFVITLIVIWVIVNAISKLKVLIDNADLSDITDDAVICKLKKAKKRGKRTLISILMLPASLLYFDVLWPLLFETSSGANTEVAVPFFSSAIISYVIEIIVFVVLELISFLINVKTKKQKTKGL